MTDLKIRKAVGAIVKQNNLFLLIRKVKMMNSLKGPEKIKPRWDFPKGGVKSSDASLNHSFLREKRIGSKRIYFLVYKEICLVLLVSASDKKSQQRSIEERVIS